ncbi:hypothetical protein ACL1CM_08075 [Corynebacterium striatum]
MGKPARLSVQILADAAKAKAGFNDAASGIDKLEDKAQKVAAVLGAASAGVITLGKQAFDAASSLQQSTGGVEAVFQGQADSIKRLADEAAQAAGLSKNEYQELATVMGAQLKNMGVSQEELTGKTSDLVAMGADLAAQFGGSTSDAVSALSSLMRGETDPIERYGVSIKQADIDAKMAALGLSELEGEAAKTGRTQALMALLTEQTSSSIGAFAREVDTAAGQQQRATAEFENAKATIGEALLPIVTDAAQKFGELARWIGEHPQLVHAAAGAILVATGVVTGLIGAIKTAKAVTDAAKAAQVAFNFVLSANPIGLIVTAVAALVAGLVYFFTQTETGKRVWEDFTRALADGWNAFVDWFQRGIDNIKNWARESVASLVGKWTDATNKISSAWDTAVSWVEQKIQAIRDTTAAVVEFINTRWQTGMDLIRGAIESVKSRIDWVRDHIAALAESVKSPADMFRWFADTANNVLGYVSDALGTVKGWLNRVADVAATPGRIIADSMSNAIGWVRNLIDWLRNAWDWITDVVSGASSIPGVGWINASAADALSLVGSPDPAGILTAASVPTLTAAYVPKLTAGTFHSLSVSPTGGTVINITVNGALDPESVATQIKRVLNRQETRQSW